MSVNSDNSLGLPLFQFENLQAQRGLSHAISTRQAPQRPLLPEVQPALRGDYRLAGRGVYNPREVIYGRRSELLTAMGFEPAKVQPNLTGVRQIHSNFVKVVGPEAYGAAFNWDNGLGDADGLVTDCPNIPLMTIHADCPPILLYDPVARVVGALHSGWRGTVAKISLAGVGLMTEQYGSQPKNILAGIGPSIGPCCYEVGEPVLSEIAAAFTPAVAKDLLSGNHHFDLWEAIRLTLLEAGLLATNIEQSRLCTLCHHDQFFSYRATPIAERHNYGQFVSVIALR